MSATNTPPQYPFLQGGGQMGALTRQYDWAASPVGPPDQWPYSLRTTVSNLLRSRFPMFLWWGEQMIQFYNDAYRPSLGAEGGKHPRALGQQGPECWPETWPVVEPLLRQVRTDGESIWLEDQLIPIVRNGRLEDVYWTFSYSLVLNDVGGFGGILVTCIETTAQVLFQQQLRQSQQQLMNLFEQAPSAIAILSQDALRIKMANPFYCAIVGRRPEELLGRPLLDALPEVANQGFDQLMNDVVRTGTPFTATQMPAQLRRQGQLEQIYVDLSYNPVREPDGSISGVFVLANDVTQSVLARQQVEETATALQNAIELAGLGTWHLDCQTGETQLSPRQADLFGLALTLLPFEEVFVIVHPDDRPRVRTVFDAAMQPGSAGHYEAEYRILHGRTGELRYIRARGQTRFDETGRPVFISGTTQDVTLERESQRLLEEQVFQRTQELQLANTDLQRSNDNLQQFAYIASHDLQEPLRKIQSFSSLLEQQFDGQLTDVSKTYLQRITDAGARMSTLIKDLLTYSRISTRQQAFGRVSLAAILDEVLSTLEWTIAERGAQLAVDALPVVSGDETQLGQLFQNLLSNALKFTPAGQSPRIQIQCFERQRSELPTAVKPSSEASRFIQISVRDEGVGFDPKYVDRIFQVFQRLHGKNEFAGTGVGLAICQRVVENHGGAITADSQLGQGATFCVYLPA